MVKLNWRPKVDPLIGVQKLIDWILENKDEF